MQKVIDPVCGMSIDPETAAGRSTFEGRDYFFCSKACKDEFDRNPEKYRHADASTASPASEDDPRWTKKGGIVAPKFGSAGSGGAEYEPLPHERRDERT
jgi:Cu+-exporting ATPase